MPRLGDEETVLVIADVTLAARANKVVQKMLSVAGYFALPQFPLHVAIGACQKKDSEEILTQASCQLIGLSFAVDADRLSVSVLPPSLDEKFIHQYSSSSRGVCAEKAAKRRKINGDVFYAVIGRAAEIANRLNKALMESSDSAISWSIEKSGEYTKSISTCNQTGQKESKEHPAVSYCRAQEQDDMESLGMEVKQWTAKIVSLCSKIAIIDKELEDRGFV